MNNVTTSVESANFDAMTQLTDDLRTKLEDLADRTITRIYAELDSYIVVPQQPIEISVRLNLERSVEVLQTGTVPDDIVAENRQTPRLRIALGVPVADIIRAYRFCISSIYDEFVSLAEKYHLSHRQTIDGANLLWKLGDWFIAGAATEYRDYVSHTLVHDSLELAELIRQLIEGGSWQQYTVHKLRTAGFDLEAEYCVCIAIGLNRDELARWSAANCIAELRERQEGRALDPPHIWHAVIGDYAVVVARGGRPEYEELGDGSWGAGPMKPLEELHDSAVIAERVCEALTRGKNGVFTSRDLGWRMAVAQDAVLSAEMVEQYLDPLHPETPGGAELKETMRAYLDEGLNVRKTADRLIVHQNTVRYRLARFQSLTGRSLDDLDTIIGLAWALDIHARSEPVHLAKDD